MFPGGPDGAGPLAPSRGDLIHNSGKTRAEALKTQSSPQPSSPARGVDRASQTQPETGPSPKPVEPVSKTTLHLAGTVPPEVWNRLGTKILPKLRSGEELRVGVEFSVQFRSDCANSVAAELRQVPDDLGLGDQVHIDRR